MVIKLQEYYKRFNSFLFPQFSSHAGKYPTFKAKIEPHGQVRDAYHTPRLGEHTDGIKLNYAKIGNGKPFIFIHGWTNNWESWLPIVKYLQDYYTLYLIDMPGFGDSDNLPYYSVEICADYIAQFIKQLPEKPQAIVGISMGSFVAGDTAFRYPDLVKSAILTGPVIKDGRHKIAPTAVDIFLKAVHRSRFSEKALKRLVETRAAAYLLAKYLNMYKFKKDLVDEYGMVGKKKVRKEAYVEMGISASSYNLKSALEKMSIPTLLVLGKEDKYTHYDFVRRNLLPRNNKLTLCVIPDAGHVVPWEKPIEVAEAIKEFFKDSTV